MPTAHPGPASCLLLGFGDLPVRSDRAADGEDPGGCSTSRAGELPAHVLRGSAGCSDWATGAEDPEGPAAHPGGASCLLLSFGDLPGRSDRVAGAEDPEGSLVL